MAVDRQVIRTDTAPKAVGPYSLGIKAGDFIFCSGQAALDPATGKLVPGGIKEQTRQILKNLEAVLQAGGSDLKRVVKVTVFLAEWSDFQGMNEVFAEFFGTSEPPARSTIQGARWPQASLLAIEAIALR
jgi:2-iminobutanoate/2-iminopropanoate deaminase